MTARKVAFIGRPGFIDRTKAKSTLDSFNQCGKNTGNLAFWHAMNEHIAGDKEFFGWTFDPEYLKSNFDVIVFPAANQLNPDWDLGGFAELLEKAQLPILICGLGAQAASTQEALNFKKGTKRFIDVVSERATKIGVRGNYTAQALLDNGIENIEVIGCPSNFISENTSLGQDCEKSLADLAEVRSVVLNIDMIPRLESKLKTMFSWSLGRSAAFINQAPVELIEMSCLSNTKFNPHVFYRFHQLLAPSVSPKFFELIVEKQFSAHFDVKSWMRHISKFDLSIGTRLHGNILAMQSGVPSVLMPHDSRTDELSNTLILPRYSLNAISSNTSLEEVVSEVQFDGISYDKNRTELASRYLQIIVETGLKPSNQLKNLTNSGKSIFERLLRAS
ncbi:MAG: hypothetical protein Alis3KO_25630 [Aliiglaciecola sp.]